MSQGPVRHSVTEGEVQCLESNTALGQVAHSDVGHVVTGAQVETPQTNHLRQGLHPGVGDVGTEAEVEAVDPDAGGDVPEGEVTDLLAVLEVEVLEVEGLLLGAELRYAGVSHLPAGPEVQPPQPPQPRGHQLQAEVRDPSTPVQPQALYVPGLDGDDLDALVRDLLTEADVEVGEGGEGREAAEHGVEGGVRHSGAAGEVEAGEGLEAGHEVLQGLLETQDLDPLDPSLDQARDDGGAESPEVEPGLAASPDLLGVEDVPPASADLGQE